MHGEEVLLEVSHVSKIFPVKKQQLRAVFRREFLHWQEENCSESSERAAAERALWQKCWSARLPVTSEGTMIA